MKASEEIANKKRLAARILERRGRVFSEENGWYRIGSQPVRFGDYVRPLLYSTAGFLFGLSLFWLMGPTEAIVITCAALLGFMYTWLLYSTKLQAFKSSFEISGEGIRLIRPGEEAVLVPVAAVKELSITLDPEEKLKTGVLKLISQSAGEVELLKLTGEKQKFIKDDLEKVRDFIWLTMGEEGK